MKKLNTKGFTLAELLIVVAIIAVLVAIAIPVFSSQLEKSREATDAANIRAAYAEIMALAISDTTTTETREVVLKQQQTGWANTELQTGLESAFNVDGYTCAITTVGQGKKATIAWASGATASASGHCTIVIDDV